MRLTITGLLKGQNKKGQNFTVIHGTTPFTQYENDNNEVFGLKTLNVYTSLNCDILGVGDVIDLNYEPGFQGQAALVGYDMVSASPFKEKAASDSAKK